MRVAKKDITMDVLTELRGAQVLAVVKVLSVAAERDASGVGKLAF